MKKTMFITSVIMVVVLAIALTTSSLAWFTAGGATDVGTSNLQISAVSAQAVGAGLEISRADDSGFSSASIDLAGIPDTNGNTVTSTMAPVAPASATTVTNNAITSIEAAHFYGALNNNNANVAGNCMWTVKDYKNDSGQLVFSSDAAIANSASGHNTGAYYKDTFYIRNSGETATRAKCTISASVTTPSQGNKGDAKLWVAVFAPTALVSDGSHMPGEEDYVQTTGVQLLALACTSQNTGMTYIFDLTDAYTYDSSENALYSSDGDDIPDLINATKLISTITEIAPIIAFAQKNVYLPGGGIDTTGAQHVYKEGAAQTIEVFAWFDGANLDEVRADTVVTISVKFETAAANVEARS